jgi:ammonium transporter Rh
MASSKEKPIQASLHIFAMIFLQVIILILFCLLVRYDPGTAMRSPTSVEKGGAQMRDTYPLFQDVHVMIFIGFGFLMTFLRRYGLSAVSLNLLCSALAIQLFTLVHGFFHLHCEDPKFEFSSASCPSSWPYIDVNVETLISADFATAAVLISFGVVLGVTSPLQLIVMTVLETIIFVVNEVIGRDYIGAVDAGDTIFVHMFGAYFGLTVARVLYNPEQTKSEKEGPSYSSDLFSMIGTIFLWMFWPSFNGGAAATGDAQQRAVINTYYSLCSCVLVAMATSALLTPSKKFVMEHLQNATLAGGVAVGACADMMLTPGGAVGVGALAGLLSVCGFQFVQPFLLRVLKVHDSCGVHNLHGMPGLLGGLVSVVLASLASSGTYDRFSQGVEDKSLAEIFPGLAEGEEGGICQGGRQALAILCTLAMALLGGTVTGAVLCLIGKLERMEGKDYFDDEWNIAHIEKEPEDLNLMIEDWKNNKLKE